jgi:hypothetical protein
MDKTRTMKVGAVAEAAGLTVRTLAAPARRARVLARHLDPDQMAVLQARTQALGPLAHYLLEVEWPELYRWAEPHRAAWHDDPASLADATAEQADSWRDLDRYLDLARQH